MPCTERKNFKSHSANYSAKTFPWFFTTFLVLVLSLQITHANELPFKTLQAKYQNYPETLVFDAVIEATRRATVSSETSGRISEINFDVDDYVKQGNILIRITDNKHRAQLSGVEANVSEAEAQYHVALADFKRIEGVFNKQLVSKSEFDKAEANLKAAEQRVSAAKAKLNEVLEQLRYTVIRAPFSGIVAERHVEVGEMSKVGQPLMTGFSLSELRAVAHIPQSNAETIRQHKEANVIFSDKKMPPLYSNQVTVYPDADPATHTYKVRVLLPEVPQGVFPGQFVKISFTAGSQKLLRIPESALIMQSELKAVYVVNKDQVALRQVRLGRHNQDGSVTVLAGLEDGETIALDPIRAAIFLKEKQ